MTNIAPATDTAEPTARLRDQIAWEAARIAEADAELEAGLYVDAAEIKTWIDSIGTTQELPPPPTRVEVAVKRAVSRQTLEDMFAGKTAEAWRAEYVGAFDWGSDVGCEIVPE